MFLRGTGLRVGIPVALCVAASFFLGGCSGKQEELTLDPGVSPFYPGPTAGKDGKAAPAPERTRSAFPSRETGEISKPGEPARLNTAFGASEVERELRLAQRALRDGQRTAAIEMLDRVLAVEPINREALYHRASLALEVFYEEKEVSNRLAAIAKGGELARTLLRAYESPKRPEIDLCGRILYAEIEARMLEGRTEAAVEALKKASDLGFNAVQRVEDDKNMATLRAAPKYKAAVKAIDDASLAQARDRAGGLLRSPPPFAFDFTLPDPDGKKFSLGDFRGKVVLVDFWGTWCGPCRQSIPNLMALYKRHHARGLEIVGLNYEKDAANDDEARSLVKQAVKVIGIPYPCLIGDEKTRERVPNFSGFPTAVLIDRSGKVRLLMVGYDEKALQQLADAIMVLLFEQPARSGK